MKVAYCCLFNLYAEYTSPIINITHKSGIFFYRGWTYSHMSQLPKVHSLSSDCLGVVHSIGLDKCIMTYIHLIISFEVFFTAPQILFTLPFHFSPYFQSANIYLFIVSIVLPFPECHIVRIIVCSLFKMSSFIQ